MGIAAVLQRIRDAVLDRSFVMSTHAMWEMRADGLDIVDIESALLTGTIRREFTQDPRGTRYEVVGTACDLSTPVGVVVRFEGSLLIITVYEVT